MYISPRGYRNFLDLFKSEDRNKRKIGLLFGSLAQLFLFFVSLSYSIKFMQPNTYFPAFLTLFIFLFSLFNIFKLISKILKT